MSIGEVLVASDRKAGAASMEDRHVSCQLSTLQKAAECSVQSIFSNLLYSFCCIYILVILWAAYKKAQICRL